MNAILNRLFLWQKFAVMGLLALVMVAAPLVLYMLETQKAINAAALEQRGIEPARALLLALQMTQQHRGLSALALGGNATARTKLVDKAAAAEMVYAKLDAIVDGEKANQALEVAWRKVREDWNALARKTAQGAITIPGSYTDHTALLAGMLGVHSMLLDHFGLTLDPEMDSYYLMDAALVQAPRLTEALGQTRAKGAGILIAKEAAMADKATLFSLLDKASERYQVMRQSMNKTAASHPALKERLEERTSEAVSQATSVTALARAQIVDAGQIDYPSADYVAKFTSAIDAQFALIAVAVDELDAMLKARHASLTRSSNILIATVILFGACGALLAYVITRSITIPLAEAVQFARLVATGNLAASVDTASSNEIGQLMGALMDMKHSLVRIVAEVRSGTETIAAASAQIAHGNLDLSSRTEEQASSLEETASSMEELTGTVRQNADNARQANQLAVTASDIAFKGGAVVSKVVSTMGAINDSSRKIVDIIAVIDGIAFQTNILALNAAVEAARAGEQGRGFAVVAAEVRNLAQRSAAAAKEIKTLIGNSVEQVGIGSTLVDQAGSTMAEIVESIKRVTDIMGEITAASQEQTSGIDQINQAITQMDDVTQQNAALVEEAAAAAASLEEQAGALARVVSIFKIGETAPAPAVAELKTRPRTAVVARTRPGLKRVGNAQA
ncbi:MAG: methyl-accepting chemotaxis protein [Pseudomonadota bacterium]